ncbi:MAG: hypothetical protein V4662_00370 [Verrucomicrobiota bacterium]
MLAESCQAQRSAAGCGQDEDGKDGVAPWHVSDSENEFLELQKRYQVAGKTSPYHLVMIKSLRSCEAAWNQRANLT